MRGKVGDAQAQLEAARPLHELWVHPGFQRWVAQLKEELGGLKEAEFGMPFEPKNAAQTKALEAVGMRAPQTPEELFRLFFIFRGVVHFWQRKLSQLERQSRAFKSLQQEIEKNG